MYNAVGLSQQFAWSLAYNTDKKNCDVYFNYAEKSLSGFRLSFSKNTSIFNTEAAFKP